MKERGKVSICNLHVKANFFDPDAEVRKRISRLDIPMKALIIKAQFDRRIGTTYKILWFKDAPNSSHVMENELVRAGYKPLVLDAFMASEDENNSDGGDYGYANDEEQEDEFSEKELREREQDGCR